MITNKKILALYVGTFNRAADANGLAYWVNDALETQEQQAIAFFESEEAQALYLPTLSTDTLVNTIYRNLFNREAEEAGLHYWVEQLENGAFKRSEMLLAIMNGAVGDDAQILHNKIEVGGYYAQQGLNMEDPYGVLEEVTAEASSVQDAMEKVDHLLNSEEAQGVHFSGGISVVNDDMGELPTEETFGVSYIFGEMTWSEDVITYSFDATAPESYEGVDFDGSTDLAERYLPLTEEEQNAVRSVLKGVEHFTALQFVEVPEDGMIRTSISDMSTYMVGYAYFPDEAWDLGGDLFLSEYYFRESESEHLDLIPGGEGYGTIVHELGHALGLEHTFEGVVMPALYDDVFHSVMSYTQPDYAYVDEDGDTVYEVLEPQLYELYDIAALQVMYGVNTEYRTGDDIYTVTYESHDVVTIWDAGGHDTIDLSMTEGNSSIDMHEGTINSADMKDTEPFYTGEQNLSIAYGVVIEDLLTGSGDDTVIDNEVDNFIFTGTGNDVIYLGSGGIDTVDGGEDIDIIYLDLLVEDFTIREGENDYNTLYADGVEVNFKNIELIGLSDGEIYDVFGF